jgi:hypothetical protein
MTISDGLGRICTERQRQITEEGFRLSGDDQYVKQELIKAAQSYLMAAEFVEQFPNKDPAKMLPPTWWPWAPYWWKPSVDPVRNLEKAGALIAAEIDRIRRAEFQASATLSERNGGNDAANS